MILVTGNYGYIGAVMTRFLQERSYDVVGLDSMYYQGCEFSDDVALPSIQINKDIRTVDEKDLEGITAVIHLAALSNDPLGDVNPTVTDEINHEASIRLAELAKKAGIERYIFSSSCSLYGIAPDNKRLTETGEFNPITAYAKAKVDAERDIAELSSDYFHPTFMRNATVYGLSPCLRLCLVVNNLVAWAYLTGKVAIMSDGTPWRPLIHVEDLCRAFQAVLEAPLEMIHNQAFNVGINKENYQVKEIAGEVEKVVPGCQVEILNKTGSDERTYQVDFSKIKEAIPKFKPEWDLTRGIEELYNAYKNFGLDNEDFESPKYFRVRWIKYLLEKNKLDQNLNWSCNGR